MECDLRHGRTRQRTWRRVCETTTRSQTMLSPTWLSAACWPVNAKPTRAAGFMPSPDESRKLHISQLSQFSIDLEALTTNSIPISAVLHRRSLNCTRVTIHKNLFLSFITNNLMWIIWYTYVVNDADLLQSNPVSLHQGRLAFGSV